MNDAATVKSLMERVWRIRDCEYPGHKAGWQIQLGRESNWLILKGIKGRRFPIVRSLWRKPATLWYPKGFWFSYINKHHKSYKTEIMQ